MIKQTLQSNPAALDAIILWIAVCTLALVDAATAADSLNVTNITCLPNYETIGILAYFDDDDNEDADITVSFRESGDTDWTSALPCDRLWTNIQAFSTALFGLQEDTKYEVRCELSDPDGVNTQTVYCVTTTKYSQACNAWGQLQTIYVSTTGDNSNAGTSWGDALETIQQACSLAGPGTTIAIEPGRYPESVYAGNKSNLVIQGVGPGVLMDGSDDWSNKSWSNHVGDIYWTACTSDVTFASLDDVRMYPFESLSSLQNMEHDITNGFYCDTGSDRIYVRVGGGLSPGQVSFRLSEKSHGLKVNLSHNVLIEGLEIGNYGVGNNPSGMKIERSRNVVVRSNTIFNVNVGIAIKDYSAGLSIGTLIEGNTVYETGLDKWEWDAIKGQYGIEGSAIALEITQSATVRRNHCSLNFDGVSASYWNDLWNPDRGINIDVYDNVLMYHGDDAFEPEGACLLHKYFRNKIFNSFQGISLAPIRIGPFYVCRNTFYNDPARGNANWIKIQNDSVGALHIYHNTYLGMGTNQNGMAAYGAWNRFKYKNNMVICTRYVIEDTGNIPVDSEIYMDNNLYYSFRTVGAPFKWDGTTYDSLPMFVGAAGFDSNSLYMLPGVIDVTNGNCHLQPSSYAIDTGTPLPNINDDYEGAAPDIGAYEFQQPVGGGIGFQAGGFVSEWATVSGGMYQLYYTPLLITPSWTNRSSATVATNTFLELIDTNAVDSKAFYKLKVLDN